MAIRPATRRDIPEIMALEARYYVGNLASTEHSGGFISILHPETWFRSVVDDGGLHVAVNEQGSVCGFFAVASPPDQSHPDISPIMKSMLELAAEVKFADQVIAQQSYAFRGPVLIDRAARGRDSTPNSTL